MREFIEWTLLLWTQQSLQWRHYIYNGCDSASNHQPYDCLLNRLFRRRSKETSKLRVTGLCEGNSPGTGEFPAQMASNAENVSIWWRHHDIWGDLSQIVYSLGCTVAHECGKMSRTKQSLELFPLFVCRFSTNGGYWAPKVRPRGRNVVHVCKMWPLFGVCYCQDSCQIVLYWSIASWNEIRYAL